MKYKRKSELKPDKRFFGLEKERFVSITNMYDQEVLFLEVQDVIIKGQSKMAIKFAFTAEAGEDPSENYLESIAHYTITKSDVIRDRLMQDMDIIPFAATVKKIKNYISYE